MPDAPIVLHVGNFLSMHRPHRQFIEELADRLEGSGWHLYRTSSRLNRPLRLGAMVNAVLLRHCDVVHITVFSGPAFAWTTAAALISKVRGRPLVMSLHGGNLPAFSKKWPRLVRRVLSAADIAIAPSPYLKDAFQDVRPDISIIPNPIDVQRYAFVRRVTVSPRIVWMRGYAALYNPQLALHVVKLLADKYPDVTLEMTGPDSGDGTLSDCRALARDLGISERVHFGHGVAKTDVPAFLSRGDVLLNTSDIDNTPTSMIEALACGLCVVSTHVGGIPRLVTNGEHALLVPPRDAAAMAAAVARLMTEPGLARRLSSSGRALAEEFDWSRILPKWQRVFRACAGFEGKAA